MTTSTFGTPGTSFSQTTIPQRLVDNAGFATRYYSRLYVEHNLNLDGSLVKEYFPVSFVVPAILDIYQNLLEVKFVEATGEAKDVWHPGE
jgi:Zn-dependent oligopeptidase